MRRALERLWLWYGEEMTGMRRSLAEGELWWRATLADLPHGWRAQLSGLRSLVHARSEEKTDG